MTYRARVVERDGTPVRILAKANVLPIVDVVNGVGGFGVTYPKHDPPEAIGQAADVRILEREIQILDDADQVVAWGVPLRKTRVSGRGDVTVTCPDVGWHLGRRNIDGPITERLVNAGFETGDLTGWTATGSTTATVITSPRRLGAYSVRLVQGTTGADRFLYQALTGVDGGDIGLYLTLATHFYIESWTGPALDARGLYVEGKQGATVRTFEFKEIDDATPRGSWQRMETGIWVPPGEVWDLNVRLYAPNGSIVFDANRFVAMESLSVALAGTDIAVMAGDVVEFIQDPAHAKDDLFIGTDCQPAGVVLAFPKAWQYVDHTPAERVINGELAPLGFDWSIEFEDTGIGDIWTKTFTTHSPRQGVDRSATVTLELGVNVASYDFDEDGTPVETDVSVLGDGDGPDREEGHAADTSDLDGLVLQGVQSAPPGTTIDMLDPMADDHLVRSKQLARLVRVTTHQRAGDLVGVLRKGDVVRLVIDDGDAQVDGSYRIVRRQLNPRSRTLDLDLNEDFGARGGIQRPDQVKAVASMHTRLRDMERATSPATRPVEEERAVFSYPDALVVGISPKYPVRRGGQLVQVSVDLVTAGSTSTTLKVYRNGAQIGSTITVLAGVTELSPYLGELRIAANDRLQTEVVTAGTGAADLTLSLTMKG